jgi:formamidopyrimidine-DNA glycosylase
MLEIPEAAEISRQISNAMSGNTITEAVVGASPHKFAWFNTKAGEMARLLGGRQLLRASPAGGMVAIKLDGLELVLSDGVSPRYYKAGEPLPDKHQLLLMFADASFLACTVQMYGGMYLHSQGEPENPYYAMALSKPSPLSKGFSEGYFDGIMKGLPPTMSLKAALATEQRIPGLGNGVLQDILLDAGLHPKSKVGSLDEASLSALYRSIAMLLRTMSAAGGRDTERDIFGRPGGYRVMAGKNTVGGVCPKCGSGTIHKESYLGGSIYFCDQCQQIR